MPPLPELRPAITNAPIPEISTLEMAPPPRPFEPEVTIAACQRSLADFSAEFLPVQPIQEAIVCGHAHPIILESLLTTKVTLLPAATSNCNMAGALARWLENYVQPAATTHFGEPVVALRNASSYVCRTRNNVPGARVSEHATANALDVSAFQLRSGNWISVLEHWPTEGPEGLLLRTAHQGGCAEFTTMLGPEANASHLDHFHLDLGRHGSTGTYRICE